MIKKLLVASILTTFSTVSIMAQTSTKDLFIGTTNNLYYLWSKTSANGIPGSDGFIWNHTKDSIGPVTYDFPFEGNDHMEFNYNISGWWGGGAFALNPLYEAMDLSAYRYLKLYWKGYSSQNPNNALTFSLTDGNGNTGPNVNVALNSNTVDYQEIIIPLSLFLGASEYDSTYLNDLTAIKWINFFLKDGDNTWWMTGGATSGVFYLDAIQLLDTIQGGGNHNTIRGNIYTDSNNDCSYQAGESPLSSVVVKVLPGSYYGVSDAYGKYQVKVDSGDVSYTLFQQYNSINSKLLLNQCASAHNVSLSGAFGDTCCFNFADSVKHCAFLNVSVQNSRMRRCFRGSTYIRYCNYGNTSTSDAEVKVEYPPYIVPISSVPAWTSRNGNILSYDIGTLSANACEGITITDSVSCVTGITGLTECIKASISPASDCTPENPLWDKSSINVTGSCSSGTAVFTIANGGTGDMGGANEYRVYVNDTLIYTETFQLNSGQSFTISYPAQGQTIRLEADQSSYHPGNSHPRSTVEGCGGIGITGLVTTSPQDDLDEKTAITCNVIRDSFDPNDKQALPSGIGSAHSIPPGEEIEYIIRFQNTGTDTAYTVIVIDTLDTNFDAASFIQGASSHPYTLGISGKGQAVLKFTFKNINLPDSTANKLASNGLVSFRIKVPSSASIGTVVKNKAYIYFDYNDPVVTNETMHTVDNAVALDYSKGAYVQESSVTSSIRAKSVLETIKIYPNPTQGIVTVEMPEKNSNTELRIFSSIGVLLKTIPLNPVSLQQVSLEGLSQGMYLYEVKKNGERKAGGLLEIR
jgi:uncharacterized repeat protein (TIGR01451 family)